MGAQFKTKINKLPKITANVQALSNKSIEVGAIQGEHSW